MTAAKYNHMVVHMQAASHPDLIFAALADGTRRDIVLRALNGHEGVLSLQAITR